MKRHAPATARNSHALAEVLAQELPERGTVLEIASGTGEHAVFMARRFPGLDWQPSDLDPGALASVDAWAQEMDYSNLRAAIALDAAKPVWPIKAADAIVCVNMVHISPWAATQGLFAGAGALLENNGPLIIYGPFIEEEDETKPSNRDFDASLRSRDPAWGLREVSQLDLLAARNSLRRSARHEMPANNLTLVYRRKSGSK